MSTLVCLVSHQPMANVIPVLELKPDNVILLQTEQEKSVASDIKSLFEEKNIKTQIFKKYLNPYNLETVKSACREIINANEKDIILNATGGTKPMAISAYEIFNSSNKRIIYYDPIHHSIIEMNSFSQFAIKVSLKINVCDYLRAHGYKIIEEKTLSGRAEEKDKFFNNMPKDRKLFFFKSLFEIKSAIQLNQPRQEKIINKFKFSKNFNKITIVDEINKNKFSTEHLNFNYGDFLEDLLYLYLKKKPNDDIKYSVKIKRNNIKSEIDVLATNNCKLDLYSCKDKKKTDKFDLFEVEILRNVAGGTFGKAHFVLSKADNYVQYVAENLGIDVLNINKFF